MKRTHFKVAACLAGMVLLGCRLVSPEMAAGPGFEARVLRPTVDSIGVTGSRRRAVVTVESKIGIGGAELHRVSPVWPDAITLCLKLHGLERLTLAAGGWSIEMSVLSHGSHEILYQVRDGTGSEIPPAARASRGLQPALRTVSGKQEVPVTIPLTSGHFEVTIPPAFLRENPAVIRFSWIDFFRN